MNRRNFLRLLSGAGTAAALAPSMVWPFRKIFLPPPPRILTLADVRGCLNDFYNDIWIIHPEQEKAWRDVLGIPDIPGRVLPSYQSTYAGLARARAKSIVKWPESMGENQNV